MTFPKVLYFQGRKSGGHATFRGAEGTGRSHPFTKEDGFNKGTSASFAVTKGVNTAVPAITLTVIQTGNVSGTVNDASGKPIADALVVLTPATVTTTAKATGAPGGPGEHDGGELVAKTNASGKYTFERCPPAPTS